jgi:hypothetical protein
MLTVIYRVSVNKILFVQLNELYMKVTFSNFIKILTKFYQS